MPVPVSVIIPTYNAEAFLREAVDSLFVQGPYPAEVIVIDNCSTDDTVGIARGLQAAHPPLRVIERERNTGAARSRSDALRVAQYDLVALLDADDWLSPGALCDAYDTLSDASADLCLFQHPLVPTDQIAFPIDGREATRLTIRRWEIHPQGIAKRQLYLNAYEGFAFRAFHADEIITRRVFMQARTIVSCQSTYHYRVHDASMSRNPGVEHFSFVEVRAWLLNFAVDEGFLTEDIARELTAAAEPDLYNGCRNRALYSGHYGPEFVTQQINQLDRAIRRAGGYFPTRDRDRLLRRLYVRYALMRVGLPRSPRRSVTGAGKGV